MWKHIRKYILLYILIPILALSVATSFFRFLVLNDYVVAYEGQCDPYTHDCYIGCADDECLEPYYFMEVEKYAPEIYAQCGEDITNCANANICLPSDSYCSITYCDPALEGDACDQLRSDNEPTRVEYRSDPMTLKNI